MPVLSRRSLATLLISALLGGLAPASFAATSSLRIGVPVWVGWMPWWVAQEKGLFKRNGVSVDLRNFAVQGDAVQALAGGKLDGASVATNDILTVNAAGPKATVVLLHDESAGADMLVTRGIDDPKKLKGQRIAVEVGGVSHFFLDKLLAVQGLRETDVTVVNMAAADAGAAFASGAINAAVTWEPFGTQAVKAGGKRLLTSKDTPGAIVDVLGIRNEVLKKRPDQVRRLLQSWFDALDYVAQHRAESFGIMAKASGVSVAEFEEMWQGVRIFSLQDNRKALTRPAGGGAGFHATVEEMGQFMMAQKLIAKPVSPLGMVSADLLPGR
jgi:NitT/TauT family transport system substrate-binding protein